MKIMNGVYLIASSKSQDSMNEQFKNGKFIRYKNDKVKVLRINDSNTIKQLITASATHIENEELVRFITEH